MSMHTKSLRELSQALKQKEFSSTELTQHFLKRINDATSLNAFISIDESQALLQAAAADQLLKQGLGKTLTGIPLAHKDIFCTNSLPTTCGSRMLANYSSPFPATIVKRLEDEGTILVGKTNMDEFGMGSSNENSYFGPVKNPWDMHYVSGGSSGGSAAAVAARLVPFATGSDTGGSVRQPAAFCGISGIKPTYGLISRFGMVAYASSLDTPGILATNAEDLAMVLNAVGGFDERDSTSSPHKPGDLTRTLQEPLDGLRIGVPHSFFDEALDGVIHDAIHEAIQFFERKRAKIVKIDLNHLSLWAPCYYVIACAEASSNLSRYDGVRFGYQSPNANTLEELITRTRSEGFGMEVKRRILTGTHVLSSGYFDAYYVQAQKVRRMIQQELLSILSNVDVILGPTTPSTAFKLGETINNPTQRYLADIFTVAANLAGLPALSIPVGFHQQLPIGMQLMGPHFGEARLLQFAHHYQQETDWHHKLPHIGES